MAADFYSKKYGRFPIFSKNWQTSGWMDGWMDG
jgi:hypothetical protein